MTIRKTASGRLTETDQAMAPTIAGSMQPGETLGPGLKRLAASIPVPPDPAAYWSAADERELAAEDLDG